MSMSVAERLAARNSQMSAVVPEVVETPPALAPSSVVAELMSRREDTPITDVGQAINPPMEYQPPMTAEQRASAEAPTRDEAGEKVKAKGRPKGSKNKATAATHEIATYYPETQATAIVIDASAMQDDAIDSPIPYTPTEKGIERPGFNLYIDCLPLGQVCTQIEIVFESVREHLLETKGLADYRYADYGKGAGFFQEALREFCAGGAIRGNIYVSSATPEGALALAPLMPLAKSVVRGMR